MAEKTTEKPKGKSNFALKQKMTLEAAHKRHSPPIYGCFLCGPVIASALRERERIATLPAPWEMRPGDPNRRLREQLGAKA